MPSQPIGRPAKRTATNTDAAAKHRRWFSLRGRPRRSRLPDERANIRAGVEVPHGYPFEPRF